MRLISIICIQLELLKKTSTLICILLSSAPLFNSWLCCQHQPISPTQLRLGRGVGVQGAARHKQPRSPVASGDGEPTPMQYGKQSNLGLQFPIPSGPSQEKEKYTLILSGSSVEDDKCGYYYLHVLFLLLQLCLQTQMCSNTDTVRQNLDDRNYFDFNQSLTTNNRK